MSAGMVGGLAAGLAHELALFAAIGFLLGGIDDLAVDLIWLARRARSPRAAPPPAERRGWLAVFVPAWDEARVIAPMLRHALACFGPGDYRIYVGCYPNDPATLVAVEGVAAEDARVRWVLTPHAGPTTKADCLNALFAALRGDERRLGPAKAVILHDAEDVVHSAELALFDRLVERYDLVQLPVVPLVDPGSRWVGGHYCDEFAEAHAKLLVVRAGIGASLPLAGTGCAIRRETLQLMADRQAGQPFDATSLTEDYELGLRVAELGGRTVFARVPAPGGEGLVAVRAYFPGTLGAAVRQKARWITGIALIGWDRLGWRGGLAETWMRGRDRRALLAALVLGAAYAALALWSMVLAGAALAGGTVATTPSPLLAALLWINLALLVWRCAMRCAFVTRRYGLREGLRSVPRVVVSNLIAILAAQRALRLYWGSRRGAPPAWDKTGHAFPDRVPAE